MNPRNTPRHLFLTLVTTAALLGSARAATWTGAGTDGKWSNAANWGGVAPYNGESLVFAVTTKVGGSNDFSAYTFQDITFSTNGFAVSGNPFALNYGINNQNSAAAGNNIVSNSITLAGPQTFYSRVANTTLTLSGNITNGGNNLDHVGPGNWVYNGIISGSGGVTFTGSGAQPANVTFANSNSYTGDTYVNGGATTSGRIALTTTNSRVGQGTLYFTTDGSTATGQGGQLYASAAAVILNEIQASGIGCSESAGHLGAIRFQAGPTVSNITLTGNTRLMAYSGTDTGTVAGTINSQGVAYNLDVNVNDSGKTIPTGTLTFNKDNSLSGGILTIGGGKLVLKSAGGLGGASQLILGSQTTATLDVSAATGFTLSQPFWGRGTITGDVAVASSVFLDLGGAGNAVTLNLTNNSSLTLADGVTMSMDFSTNAAALGGGTNDLILCSNLTVNGTVTINPNFTGVASPVLNQPYTIIKYSGTYSGPGSFVLATGFGYSINTSTGAVTVTFTALTPRNLTWSSAYGQDWDVNLTPNWTLNPGGTQAKFYSRDNVTFNDSAPYTSINLPASLTPGNMTFNNSVDYSLGTGYGGPGALIGGSPLVKSGPGSLTINTTNTAYDGTITINQGTLIPGNASALGTANGSTVISSGATLNVNAVNLGAEPVIASGTGVGGKGAIVNNGPATQLNALRFVTLAGDTTMGGNQRWDIRGNATASLSTSNQPYNLTVAMDNSASLTPYYPYFALVSATVDPALGNIHVISGALSFEVNSTSLGNPASNLLVEAGSAFQMYGATNFLNKTMTFRDGSVLSNYSGANVIVGPVTLESGTVVGGIGGTALRLDGPVLGNAALLTAGGGGLLFNGTNSSTGGLTVPSGGVGGSGYITGAPVVVTNAAVSPGTNGLNSPGTLTLTKGLTLLANSSLTFDFTNNTAVGGGNDLISLSDGTTAGTLTLDGPITVNANPMAGNLVAGTYTLITNGSATLIPNSATIIAGSSLPIGARYGSPSFDLSTPGTLRMTIPTTGDKLVWQGLYNSTWDTDAFSYSWSNAVNHANPDFFYNSDSVVFDDSATTFAVTLNGPVLPASVVLANNVNSYTFSSTATSNRISGGVTVVQTGSATNIMSVANNNAGGTIVKNGTLRLGLAGAFASSIAYMTNSGTLDVNGLNTGAATFVIAGDGFNGRGAIVNDSTTDQINAATHVTLATNASVGGVHRWDIRGAPNTTLLSSGGKPYTLTVRMDTNGVGNNPTFSIVSVSVDPGLGDIDVQSGVCSFEVNSTGLGNPTNNVIVRSGATFQMYAATNQLNKGVVFYDRSTLNNASGADTILGPISLVGGIMTNNVVGTSMTLAGPISGSGRMLKQGASPLYLTGTNSNTGGILISVGTLNIGNNTPGGDAGTGPVTNNTVLQFNRTRDLLWNNTVTGSGTWLKLNTNTMTVAGTNVTTSTAGPSISSVGNLIITNGGFLGGSPTNVAGQIWLGGNSAAGTCVIATGGTLVGPDWITVGRSAGGVGTLTLNGGTLVKQGANNLILGSLGATGTLTVNSGVISNSAILYIAETTATGVGYLNLNGGRVQASQITKRTVDAKLAQAVFNGGTLQAVGNQANYLAIDVAYASTNGLVFDTGATNVVTIAQSLLAWTNLPASAPNAGLVKLGASSLTLTGTNSTYIGNTVVSNGTLALNSRLTGGGTVVVNPGATLVGTGTNTGPATINGTLAVGGLTPSVGTLAFGSTTFGNGATNVVDLVSYSTAAGGGTNDLLVVNGNLDLSNPSKIVFSFLNGAPAFGSPYTLITYTGTLTGTPANLLPVLPLGVSAAIANTAGTPNAITVTFSNTAPRAAASLVWYGDGLTNLWAIGTPGQWRTSPGGAPDAFYDLDSVLVNDLSTNRTVNLSGSLAPATAVVNIASNYTFTGTGLLGGAATLTKQGPGTLALRTTNGYYGGTIVSGGILQLGTSVANLGAPIGGVICQVTNGGALDLNGVDLSVSTNILYLAGAYSNNAIGAVYSSTTFAAGRGLKYVTLTGDASIGTATSRMDFNSGILNGGGFNLTKVGSGQVSLWSAGGYATNLASVTIAANGGILEMGNGGWFTLNCPLFVNSNAQVNFYNLNANFTNTPVTLSFGTWNNSGGNGTNAGPVTLAAGTTNYVTCTGGNSLNFLGPIGGAGALMKNNTSALPVRLLTNNTYTGATIVNQGTLVLGVNGSIASSPVISVSSGATFDASAVAGGFPLGSGQTLAGSGTALGSVVGASGAKISVGGDIAGTLTLANNLTLAGNNSLQVDLTNNVTEGGGNDLLLINGNAIFTSPVTVNCGFFVPPILGTPYTIVRCVGTLTVDTTGWVASGTRYPATFSSTDGKTVQVTFSAAPVGSTSLVWQGDPSQGTNWAVNVTGWVNGSGATVFYNSDSVTFNDSAANLTAYLPAVVYPNSVVVNATRNYTFTGAGRITGPAGLTKSGSGSLVTYNNNDYTGPTVVSGGTLVVNGSLGPNTVSIAGGSLGGTGTIRGPVTVQATGILAPGTSVGTLTISNTLTLAAGSTTAVEIDKTAGTYDRVQGLSTVTLGGTLSVSSLAAPLAAGDSFKLFTATTYTGAFASIAPAAPGAGLGWDTNSLTVDGTLKVISVAGPQITKAFLSGANFVFSGSNGVPNATYNVLASTNVVTPLSQWIQVGTSTFGPDGSFSYTNTGSTLDAQFFMLKVP